MRSPRNGCPPWSSLQSASVFTLETEFVLYHVPSTLDMDLTMYGLINRSHASSVAVATHSRGGLIRDTRHRDADSTGQSDDVQCIGGYDFLYRLLYLNVGSGRDESYRRTTYPHRVRQIMAFSFIRSTSAIRPSILSFS